MNNLCTRRKYLNMRKTNSELSKWRLSIFKMESQVDCNSLKYRKLFIIINSVVSFIGIALFFFLPKLAVSFGHLLIKTGQFHPSMQRLIASQRQYVEMCIKYETTSVLPSYKSTYLCPKMN